MKITIHVFIVGMMVASAANARIQVEEIFEFKNGVVYDSRDLTNIPDPAFILKRIERELIQRKVDYIEAGPTLRWLAASLDCESNAIYRAEYKTHIHDWIEHATNWPAVLMLSSDLDAGESYLFNPPGIWENRNSPDPAVCKVVRLDFLMREYPLPVEEDEEGNPQKKAITDKETRLTATIDSIRQLGDKIEVRYTVENNTTRSLWMPHFPSNQGWFLIERADGFSSVSSDRLKGGFPRSWRLFYAGERETRTAIFTIGKYDQVLSGRSSYWYRDPTVVRLLKKYDIRFLGDTAIARGKEKKVELNITLDNPEMLAWLQRRDRRFVPDLPKLKGLPENHTIKKCTGFICEPVSITLDLTQ